MSARASAGPSVRRGWRVTSPHVSIPRTGKPSVLRTGRPRAKQPARWCAAKNLQASLFRKKKKAR
eukprot:11201821-Lingulodinium_polyedra.AAC.1